MRKYILSLVAILVLLPGCATLIDLGQDICDAAFEGSKAGALCEEMDKLKADEPVVDMEEPVE